MTTSPVGSSRALSPGAASHPAGGRVRPARPHLARCRSAPGFTLLELILVALVLAVLLGGALPQFRQRWVGLQVERVAFELAQSLRAARALAVTQGTPVAWIWDPDDREVWLGTPQDGGAVVPVPGRLGRPRALPDRVTLVVLQEAQPVERVSFFPDGTSQPTELRVGHEDIVRYSIDVYQATGRVLLKAPSG